MSQRHQKQQQQKKSTHYGTHLYNGERISSSVANEPTTVKGSTATVKITTIPSNENRIIMSNGDKFKGTQRKMPHLRERNSKRERDTRDLQQEKYQPTQLHYSSFGVCVCVSFHWSFLYLLYFVAFSFLSRLFLLSKFSSAFFFVHSILHKISCAFSDNSNFMYW